MFNTNFSNKTQLKIIFFNFVGSNPVQCIALNRTGPTGTVEPCSTVHGSKLMNGSTVHKFTQHKKQQGAASCKPVAVPQLVVGPTNQKMLFLLYQTIIVVAAGEPHPQPQYQRAPSWLGIEIHNLFWFVFYGVISVLWLELWVWKVNSTCFFMSFFKFIYLFILSFNI